MLREHCRRFHGVLRGLVNWPDRERRAVFILALFVLANLTVLCCRHPWKSLPHDTWPVGYESARIARNMLSGAGYSSPFARFVHDDFGGEFPQPVEEPRYGPISGEGYRQPPPTAWITPPNVFQWFVVFAVFGIYSPGAMIAFYISQTVMMAGAVYLAWDLLRRYRGGAAAGRGLWLFITYPSLSYFCIKDNHSTTLMVFLLMGSMWSFDRYRRSGRPWRWALASAGLLMAAVLSEPPALLFALLWVPMASIWSRRTTFRIQPPWYHFFREIDKRWFAAAGVMVCAIWGPWWIRNAYAFGRPILFKTNLPVEFFYGNNPDSEKDLMEGHIRRFAGYSPHERALLLGEGEIVYGQRCWKRFFDFVQRNPLTFAELCVRRLTWYWSYLPYKPNPWRPMITTWFLAVVFVGVIGGWIRFRSGWCWIDTTCILFALTFPLIYYLTHFMIYRYRFPVEFLLILSAASAWGRNRSESHRVE